MPLGDAPAGPFDLSERTHDLKPDGEQASDQDGPVDQNQPQQRFPNIGLRLVQLFRQRIGESIGRPENLAGGAMQRLLVFRVLAATVIGHQDR